MIALPGLKPSLRSNGPTADPLTLEVDRHRTGGKMNAATGGAAAVNASEAVIREREQAEVA